MLIDTASQPFKNKEKPQSLENKFGSTKHHKTPGAVSVGIQTGNLLTFISGESNSQRQRNSRRRKWDHVLKRCRLQKSLCTLDALTRKKVEWGGGVWRQRSKPNGKIHVDLLAMEVTGGTFTTVSFLLTCILSYTQPRTHAQTNDVNQNTTIQTQRAPKRHRQFHSNARETFTRVRSYQLEQDYYLGAWHCST